ncbi:MULTISPECIES: TetR family transcriptional regulator [unclassified Streptomyces]|uniref:TetR family transcriptional regulator n=1 Tax=unclassified Streptomyces TaxID=2593676 RepID=UPI003805F21F
MARWNPGAEERLRDAGLDLFVERGYDQVIVQEITERAGLTRRTFSRYFTDKRDILFAGSDRLPPFLADAVRRADGALPPFDALIAALAEVGTELTALVSRPVERQAVIRSSPELQERERTKLASLAAAAAGALEERGVAPTTAALFARVAVDLFQAAFEECVDTPDRGFAACLDTKTELLGEALGTRSA